MVILFQIKEVVILACLLLVVICIISNKQKAGTNRKESTAEYTDDFLQGFFICRLSL